MLWLSQQLEVTHLPAVLLSHSALPTLACSLPQLLMLATYGTPLMFFHSFQYCGMNHVPWSRLMSGGALLACE